MTQQDNQHAAFEAQIELPPLPRAKQTDSGYWREDMQSYARAAIAQDRQSRGEPVAWRYRRRCEKESADMAGRPSDSAPWHLKEHTNMTTALREGRAHLAPHRDMVDWQPLFEGLRPAEPTVKDSLTTAEPVKCPDDIAVDAFAAAMKAKLAKKRDEGRGNWEECSARYLSRFLRECVEKGDPVDVANLAMMLHQNGQRIEPVKVPSAEETTAQQNAFDRGKWFGARYGNAAQPTESAEPTSNMIAIARRNLRSFLTAPGRFEFKVEQGAALNCLEVLEQALDAAPVAAQPSVPDEWKLVPVEPDWNMEMSGIQKMLPCASGELECIGEKALDSYRDDVNRIYQAMLEAAPTPPADAQEK